MSSAQSKAPSDQLSVVINDASCLIDLHKVDLIEAMLALPYRFVVALPVRENELLDFTAKDWRKLEKAGLGCIDLSGEQVGRAIEIKATHAKLSAEDCFSLILAQDQAGSVLLTGDGLLRRVAENSGVDVHGVLWVTDELHRHRTVAPGRLITCLGTWLNDPLVMVPDPHIQTRLKAYQPTGGSARSSKVTV